MKNHKPIRVIQYGIGAMGSNMIQIIHSRRDLKLVGAIDNDPNKIGKDAGIVAGLTESLGIPIQYPPEKVLKNVRADIVLLATTAFIKDAYPQIAEIINFNLNVITITQELVYPFGENKETAKKIHNHARKHRITVSAIGINPGFIMDLIPIIGSAPCQKVSRIEVSRFVDFSPYGPDEMQHIGVGYSKAEFEKGVQSGVIGHIGLLETAHCVAETLRIPIDSYKQIKKPLISDITRTTKFTSIPPDTVYGFVQTVYGYEKENCRLEFILKGIVGPSDEEKAQMGDHTRIFGIPSVDILIKEEISQKGGIGTAAMAVNYIPIVITAPEGFYTFSELKCPHYCENLPD